MHTIPPRQTIAPEYTWNATSVFASAEAWEAEFDQVVAQLPTLAQFEGRLQAGPAVLLDYFETYVAVGRRAGALFVYAFMDNSVDTTNQGALARRDRMQGLYARLMATVAFVEPTLLAIGAATLGQWMEAEPELAQYAHYFDRIERQRQHVRSPEVETLLRQVVEPFNTASTTHGILTNADLTFDPAHDIDGDSFEIVQGNINALITHPDREVRRTAWENYADAHLAMKNTLANCLATGVKQNVFMARARQYPSALTAALHPNHIPVAVFQHLIATFRKHLPTWHRYWRVRRQALGYDTLHVYDTKAPLTTQPLQVPLPQAMEWVVQGMQPLGDSYVAVMERGLREERWVDVYPNQGKRAGAFSTGVQGTHPFIMMSYNNDVFGLSTLAHELGHSMHKYYTCQSQPFVYANYGLFVAEVASNFNQALVRAYLLDQDSDRHFQIAVLEEAMANFHRYLFIMPTLARFELAIHEQVEQGKALTADSMMLLMADLFQEGYGGEVAVDPDRLGITWAQFATHMYANFYVYQYATGISGAHALASGVLAGKPDAVENYLSFLRAGSSLYPLDALRLAGVDMSSPAPVERMFQILEEYVARLERLLGGREA